MIDKKKIDEIKDILYKKFKDCKALSYFLEENEDSRDDSSLQQNILNYLDEKKEKYHYFTGATKVVFCFDDIKDVIIKIPYDGYLSTYSDDYYDEEPEEIPFDVNYCDEETAHYKYAEEEKLADFFAETRFIAEINGRKFYAQEYIPVSQLDIDDFLSTGIKIYNIPDFAKNKPQKELVEKSKEIQSEINPQALSDDWFAKVIEYYGEKKSENLLTFLDDYSINDLHRQNIGYRSDGSPCIFDFSGYYDY